MTSQTLPVNINILCIPRVRQNISESHIHTIFDDLNMGILDRIDIVNKKNDKHNNKDNNKDNNNKDNNNKDNNNKFNRVFIHFRQWNDSENAMIARERLLEGKEIKIIYDDPWFWKVSAYRESNSKKLN
jgi:hypothetical protein